MLTDKQKVEALLNIIYEYDLLTKGTEIIIGNELNEIKNTKIRKRVTTSIKKRSALQWATILIKDFDLEQIKTDVEVTKGYKRKAHKYEINVIESLIRTLESFKDQEQQQEEETK